MQLDQFGGVSQGPTLWQVPLLVKKSRVPALVQDEALLDDIIDRLLDARQSRPGKQVQLSEQVDAALLLARCICVHSLG